MSHKKKQHDRYRANRAKVQQILGWSDLEYAEYQEQQGYAYLRDILRMTASQTAAFAKSAAYWRWWINQWDYLDCFHYLPSLEHIRSRDLEQAYLNIHEPAYIVGRVDEDAWEEAFAVMADQEIARIRAEESSAGNPLPTVNRTLSIEKP